ncbi:MAG: ATPase [Bacteroidales bacterium]
MMFSTIIIADSGSTKTDWRVVEGGRINSYATAGLNPFFQSEEEIYSLLRGSFLEGIAGNVDRLYFYGAGCLAGAAHDKMAGALGKIFRKDSVFVSDDLMAAARATLKDQAGIACILGTGSNSCFYNGSEIIDRIPAMGFILGDEGSGAVMGKKLVNAYFKNEMPSDLQTVFMVRYRLKLEEVLAKVYREPFPNRYLAGFSYFLSEQKTHPWIHAFIKENLREFIRKNVCKYKEFEKYPVSFTGSLAGIFKNELVEVLPGENIKLGVILEKPIEALVEFHLGQYPSASSAK